MMHVDEVLCYEENGGATWETSHGGCIMRKVVSKEVTAGGRFDFFLDSENMNGTGILMLQSCPLLFLYQYCLKQH